MSKVKAVFFFLHSTRTMWQLWAQVAVSVSRYHCF
jgi:hypothetical protein